LLMGIVLTVPMSPSGLSIIAWVRQPDIPKDRTPRSTSSKKDATEVRIGSVRGVPVSWGEIWLVRWRRRELELEMEV
jgi:hypothetical protein